MQGTLEERPQTTETGLTLPLPYYCTATSKRTQERCSKRAIPGGRVCRYHGGNAPHVREAANGRLRELQSLALDRLIEDLDPNAPGIDPETKLKIIDRMQHWLNLSEGKATSREDRTETTDMRKRLELRIEQVSTRLIEADAKPITDMREAGYIEVERVIDKVST